MINIKSSTNYTGTRINTIFYNDLHGSRKYLDSFLDAREKFYKEHKDEINLTLCGGDMFVDASPNNDTIAEKLGPVTDATSIGNHDLESGNYLAELINKFNLNGKFLSANLFYTTQTPLKKSITKSTIINQNGERIGIIGISPIELRKIMFIHKNTDFIKVKNFNQTIQSVRNEVKKLEAKKIDKIFLLAHTGNFSKDGIDYYKSLAKIGGIDVIIGGHDHVETDRWETSERGEPVKITATGRSNTHGFGKNLDIIGKLKLEFDKNGVLIKEQCQTTFEKLTPIRNKNEKVIYKMKTPITEDNALTGYSPSSNIVADSNLWYANAHTKTYPADFALVNGGSIRDKFDNTDIIFSDIQNVVPFKTAKLIKTTLSKKQIINTLNWCCLSTSFGKITPGLMQVSGLEYSINPDLTVCDVHILNKDGSIKYNLDDFEDNDAFSAVYDVFLATGPAGLKDLKKDCENDPSIEIFDASRQDALLEYLTKCTDIKDYTTARINKLPELCLAK